MTATIQGSFQVVRTGSTAKRGELIASVPTGDSAGRPHAYGELRHTDLVTRIY